MVNLEKLEKISTYFLAWEMPNTSNVVKEAANEIAHLRAQVKQTRQAALDEALAAINAVLGNKS